MFTGPGKMEENEKSRVESMEREKKGSPSQKFDLQLAVNHP